MGTSCDLKAFDEFKFEHKPVGVKFCLTKPRGIRPLAKRMAFCEMLKEAQNSPEPFYSVKGDHECKAGPILLGMCEPDPVFESGQVGPMLGVYEDPRANRKLYMGMHRMERDTVNFVLFSPLDKLSFDPDLLIVTATPSQAEIILRAYSYRTGAAWNAKGTTVVGCAYLYTYPYATGELNLMVTGLHHGMKARQLFKEGLLFLSIPYSLLPEITGNLRRIQWDLPQYSWGKERHLERMKEIAASVKSELERSFAPGED